MDKRSYRRFTAEEKRTILAQTQQPGVTRAEVCRKHSVSPGLVYRWRAVAQQATTEALQKVDSRGKSAPDAQTTRLEAELERMLVGQIGPLRIRAFDFTFLELCGADGSGPAELRLDLNEQRQQARVSGQIRLFENISLKVDGKVGSDGLSFAIGAGVGACTRAPRSRSTKRLSLRKPCRARPHRSGPPAPRSVPRSAPRRRGRWADFLARSSSPKLGGRRRLGPAGGLIRRIGTPIVRPRSGSAGAPFVDSAHEEPIPNRAIEF